MRTSDFLVGILTGIVAGGLLFLCMGLDPVSALCGIVATFYYWFGFYSGRNYPGESTGGE